jgi:L-fuculose-phosphate aldolase
MLADEGHARTLAGQITARAPTGRTFWTTEMSVGFRDTCAGDIVLVDEEMNVVEGKGMPNPAVRFHMWIYAHRQDVNCIVHTHPPHASALGMIGQELLVAHMDSMVFYEDCAFLRDWPGLPVANEEGRLISQALADKSSILLAHHGLLTVGKSIEEAVYRAVLLEHAAQVQLLAQSAGSIKAIQPQLARQARDFLLKDKFVAATFDYWARTAGRRYPEVFS